MPSSPILAFLLLRFFPRETWKRNQYAVNIAAGLVFFGFTLVMPFLPLYVVELGVVGVGRIAIWSGILLSAPPLIAALLGPVWGKVGDRYGMKLMVGRVLTTMTVVWGLMYFATNIYHVLALRILLGIFSGFSAMSAALVTQACPRDKIGRAIGSLQATQILSTAVGPMVGGILFAAVGIRNAFLVTSGFCLIALALILLLYRDVKEPASPRRESEVERTLSLKSHWREMKIIPGFLVLIPYLFFVSLVSRSFSSVIPLYVQWMLGDFPKEVATASGAIVTAYALAGAGSALLTGRVMNRFKPHRLLALVLSGAATLTFLLVLCRTPWQFLGLRLLTGFLMGGAITLGYSVGGAFLPAARRATLYGVLSSVTMLGGAAGPLASGVLVGVQIQAPFVAAGLTYLFLVPWVFLTLRKLPPIGRAPDPPPALRTRPVNQP